MVDSSGVKWIGKDAAMYLIEALRQQHVISIDWSGSNYLGFTLDWNYKEKNVTLSMPHHFKKALARSKHIVKKNPTHSPTPYEPPTSGAKSQCAPIEKS